mgnify:CR=1 FL=1
MRLDTGRLRDEPEISLTSLIDVVFTLIIFFVITTTFDERAAIELNLPESSAPTAVEAEETLVVVVDGEGRYFVGDQEVLRRDVESLRAAIARVAGDNIDNAKKCVGAIGGGIRATKYLDVINVLDSQRNLCPVHRGQSRTVYRTAVNQHLQASGLGNAGAVVIDIELVAASLADHHAGHQTEDFGNVARA